MSLLPSLPLTPSQAQALQRYMPASASALPPVLGRFPFEPQQCGSCGLRHVPTVSAPSLQIAQTDAERQATSPQWRALLTARRVQVQLAGRNAAVAEREVAAMERQLVEATERLANASSRHSMLSKEVVQQQRDVQTQMVLELSQQLGRVAAQQVIISARMNGLEQQVSSPVPHLWLL